MRWGREHVTDGFTSHALQMITNLQKYHRVRYFLESDGITHFAVTTRAFLGGSRRRPDDGDG